MIRRPPRSTRTDTLFPYTTLFRSPRSGIPRLATSKERRLDGGYQKGGSSPSGSRPVYVAECLDHGCGGIGIARICAETVADESKPGSSRSEEHTSELQSLMRISYAVFCLKKNRKNHTHTDRQ